MIIEPKTYKLGQKISRLLLFQFSQIKSRCQIKMTPINIKNLPENEVKDFLDSFDTVLTDCDGKYNYICFLILCLICILRGN